MGLNEIEKFEHSLPFNRIAIQNMFARIEAAESACAVEGCVTIDTLHKQLTTQAWASLANPNSTLVKVLLSDAFKNEKNGTDAEHIDANYLRCFALLHCPGNEVDKARALYEIFQGIGGLEKHKTISAGDKDIIPNFEKICAFASADIFVLAHEHGMV